MKAKASDLRALDPATRLVLLYGSDASASADLAHGIVRRTVDANEIVIAAAALTADPAALAAAASEIPMFGGPQIIRVDDAGEDVLPAVEQLLAMPTGGSLAVVVAGALKKGSKLVARIEGARDALAIVNYLPDAASAAAVAVELAAEAGVRLSRAAVTALVQGTGGDRGLLRQEITKLALYLDAAADRRVDADVDAVVVVGADFGQADLDRLIDGIAGGDPAVVADQLTELGRATAGIVVLRAAVRRFWLLLDLRAAVDGGASAARAVELARPPVFWKQRPVVAGQIARWSTPAIRLALRRLLAAERAIKRSGSAGDVAVGQLLLGLAARSAD